MTITPEMHERIQAVYAEGVGNGQVKALAEETGLKASMVSDYANKQGWVDPKGPKPQTKKALEMREMASLHCERFQECLDVAAKKNVSMECHRCEGLKFIRDTYQKEVNLANISRSGAGEQSVKVEEISCPASAAGISHKNKTRGIEVMENHKKVSDVGCQEGETKETQVCKDPACEAGGSPQSIGNFQIHGPSGKRLRVCTKCMSRKISEGHQRRKKRDEHPTSNVQRPTSNKKPGADGVSLTIDFSNHPRVLESIKQIAKDELRTPGNQVLYWLKEFSVIVKREEREGL